ncbi:MAG: PEP-utilizing enzyme [Dehalococcoidia bacterium]
MAERHVEFRLPGPEYEAIGWVYNEHLPGSATLLERSIRSLQQRTQADGLPGQLYVNGYAYSRDWQMPPRRGPFDLEAIGGWRERLFPAIEEARTAFDAFDPASVEAGSWRDRLLSLDAGFDSVFGRVHMETMAVVLPASSRWLELHAERFGAERRDDALALLAGFPNTSTARTSALWGLSRIAAADEAVAAAVREGEVPEGGSAGARAFREQFAALVELFGDTTTMHLIDLPTWREDASIPLAMVAAMALEGDERDPGAAEARAKARRLELERELSMAGLDEEAWNVLQAAQQLAPVSEDHNLFCDQRLIAASRRRWLRAGEAMRERGLLRTAEEVFYLSVDEVVEGLETGERVADDLIERRRAQQTRWRAAPPPARLGAGAEARVEEGAWRGIAGSRGVYQGRARVIASLEDAWQLEPGDVLVCAATAPEWTPYFGVIGALVTGAGGVLTHAAVVARELGLPAVVGMTGATSEIPDGSLVIVDGSAGTVRLATAEG